MHTFSFTLLLTCVNWASVLLPCHTVPSGGWWKGGTFEEYTEDVSLNHTFFFLVLYGLHQWCDGRFISILV